MSTDLTIINKNAKLVIAKSKRLLKIVNELLDKNSFSYDNSKCINIYDYLKTENLKYYKKIDSNDLEIVQGFVEEYGSELLKALNQKEFQLCVLNMKECTSGRDLNSILGELFMFGFCKYSENASIDEHIDKAIIKITNELNTVIYRINHLNVVEMGEC